MEYEILKSHRYVDQLNIWEYDENQDFIQITADEARNFVEKEFPNVNWEFDGICDAVGVFYLQEKKRDIFEVKRDEFELLAIGNRLRELIL